MLEYNNPISVQSYFSKIARRRVICSLLGRELNEDELREAAEELAEDAEAQAAIEGETLRLLMESRETNELAINYHVCLMSASGLYRYHPSRPDTFQEYLHGLMERYDPSGSMYANAMTVATLIVPYLMQSGQEDKIALLWKSGSISKTREMANAIAPVLRQEMGVKRGRKSPVGEEESRKVLPETKKVIDEMIEAVQNEAVTVSEFRDRFRGSVKKEIEPIVVFHKLNGDGGGVVTIQYETLAQLRYLEKVLRAPNCDWRFQE